MKMEKDFSNYKIYIPEDWRSGDLYENDGDFSIFPEGTVFDFEEGIKIILKEKRGLYLPNHMYTLEYLKYFKELGVAGFEYF